jgi:hypothetical protein
MAKAYVCLKGEQQMSSPDLSNLYQLTNQKIENQVTETSAGVYALDASSSANFVYSYVGRSDTDVAGRLKKWVGPKYQFFKFAYCSSPKAAFEAECVLYHRENPPDNDVHPKRPDDSAWKCPRCNIFN